MWTVCAGQTDSIKFSAAETKILLEHHLNYPRLQKIVDSCEAQSMEFKRIINNDNTMLFRCEELNKTKDITISITEAQVKEKEKQTKKEHFWKTFWKSSTGAVGILGITGNLYQSFKH